MKTFLIDIFSIFNGSVSSRSSDSAKYTNKSSGTSVLSGNFISIPSHLKIYSGNKNHEKNGESHRNLNIPVAPVHKKFNPNLAHNDTNNRDINRFNINNTIQTYTNHYLPILNRNSEYTKLGVGSMGKLTSPYSGNGLEKVFRGSKSDIGIPLDKSTLRRSVLFNSNFSKSSVSSMNSELSIYKGNVNMNDNFKTNPQQNSESKNVSKHDWFLYTNSLSTPHGLQPKLLLNKTNSSNLGPLIFKNNIESESWKHSVHDNPIRSVSLEDT